MHVADRTMHILMTLLLPLSLVSGLLTFPTICSCGAEMPHEHALYAVANHTHVIRNESGVRDTESDDIDDAASEVGETAGVSVQSPGYTLSGKAQTAAIAGGDPVSSERATPRIAFVSNSASGTILTPESPPPQG